MFERFTDKARHVLANAQNEARLLGHNFIGTEHLVLALTGSAGVAGDVLRDAGLTVEDLRAATVDVVGSGPVSQPDARALEAIGIDLDAIRSTVEAEFGVGALDMTRAARRRQKRCASPPFTPAAKKALELSLRQALHLGDSFIGTEHLILGVLHEERSAARRVIERAGGDPQTIVTAVTMAISRRRTDGPGSPGSSATRAARRGERLRRRLRPRARRGRPGLPPM